MDTDKTVQRSATSAANTQVSVNLCCHL